MLRVHLTKDSDPVQGHLQGFSRDLANGLLRTLPHLDTPQIHLNAAVAAEFHLAACGGIRGPFR